MWKPTRGGIPDPEGDTARRAELDGRGQFPQTDREHEAKERVPVSDGRGLLPALPPEDQAPVGTGRLQARLSGRETSPDRQRESAVHALGALRRLQDPKVVDPGRILVFCSEAKKTLFESQPEVSEVVVYQPGQNWRNIRTILGLAMMRVDVVVAILSPRPMFRPHKRLFRILPTRARLVFNEHGDCYYVTRSFQFRQGNFGPRR